jgi:hypothetical protein
MFIKSHMSIKEKQNSQSSIMLLSAQRRLYSEAKMLYLIRLVAALFLASLSPIIFFLWPVTRFPIALISGIWVLASRLILKRVENQKIKLGATIQEQFDVQVFEIPWNSVLVGSRVGPEIVSEADRNFKGDRKDLENWYSDPGDLPTTISVLLCQRSSLVWDSRLRRVYAWIISLVTIGLIGFGFILAIVTRQTLPDYLLALFLPALSALITGVEEATENFKLATEKEEIEKKVSSFLEKSREAPSLLSIEDCRKVQDYIFFLRSKSPLVPDMLYQWLKPKYQFDMEAAVANLKDQTFH